MNWIFVPFIEMRGTEKYRGTSGSLHGPHIWEKMWKEKGVCWLVLLSDWASIHKTARDV